MFRILVVEDDVNTNRLLSAILKLNGYEVIPAFDGQQALEQLDRYQVDLMIADVMMPKLDGFALTQTLRDAGSTLPILMVTAKTLPEDKRRGFLVGTDDYMTKPVDKEEMLLRIRALLRRAHIVNERKIVLGPVTLEYDTHTVRRGPDVQVLPPKEFYLLYKLLAYPERTFTRLQLLDEIWGMDSESDEKQSMYISTDYVPALAITRNLKFKRCAEWATGRCVTMLKKIKNWAVAINLTFILTLNYFLITVGVLGGAALVCWLGIQFEFLTADLFLEPATILIILYCICIVIGISVVVMIQKTILDPMHKMIKAVQELPAEILISR